MILKSLALAAGLSAGAALSQFPEFSQQYMQRLSGAVDELAGLSAAFDASAAAAGLSRGAALEDLSGSAFQDGLRASLAERLDRHDRLSAHLADLRAATPLQRLLLPQAFAEPALLQRTWDSYRPAVPMTRDGLFCAVTGFLGGLVLVRAAGALWRRRRARAHPPANA